MTLRLVLALACATLLAAWHLDLTPRSLVPSGDALELVGDVFGAALTPAWTYEASNLPADTPPFVARVGHSLLRTLVYALAAFGLALAAGAVLGYTAATSWRTSDPLAPRRARLGWGPGWFGIRALLGVLRAGHELLWALLLLAALGLTPLAAVLALAIPHAAILARVFAELADEGPRDTALLLRASGAGRLQEFVFGTLPGAREDLLAYAMYRFECLLRGAAVLGFFGVETTGKYVRDAFEQRHFHEMWSYVLALVVLIVGFELWSGAVRRRLA